LDRVFPIEVHWNQKSESVTRILDAWNIAADSVVFVDDSPSELAEVKAVHPGIECLQYHKAPQDIYDLVIRLRNLFARSVITDEDQIRAESLRRDYQVRETRSDSRTADAFLEQSESVLTLSFEKTRWDPRVLELLNKTNQFNLNGKRFTETELRRRLADPRTVLLTTSYTDKFGRLGKIMVLLGRSRGTTLSVDSWVMSCRAFSRRIEHACLDHLFKKFDVNSIEFDFASTDRNKPFRDFIAEFLDDQPTVPFRLTRDLFYQKCVRFFHQVEDEVYE
jgi:FkbH-like protein